MLHHSVITTTQLPVQQASTWVNVDTVLMAHQDMGSWPYILAIEFTDDNVVGYGGDSISVTYGNTDDETSIDLANRNPGRTEPRFT